MEKELTIDDQITINPNGTIKITDDYVYHGEGEGIEADLEKLRDEIVRYLPHTD